MVSGPLTLRPAVKRAPQPDLAEGAHHRVALLVLKARERSGDEVTPGAPRLPEGASPAHRERAARRELHLIGATHDGGGARSEVGEDTDVAVAAAHRKEGE